MRVVTFPKTIKSWLLAVSLAFMATVLATLVIFSLNQPGSRELAREGMKDKGPVSSKQKMSSSKPVEKTVETTQAPERTQSTTNEEQTPQTPSDQTAKSLKNPYIEGYGLWYAFDMRQKAGKQVGYWGNAPSWPSSARAAGVLVDRVPQPNDTAVYGTVYQVDLLAEGGFIGSTMNNGQLQTITVTKEQVGAWVFIH